MFILKILSLAVVGAFAAVEPHSVTVESFNRSYCKPPLDVSILDDWRETNRRLTAYSNVQSEFIHGVEVHGLSPYGNGRLRDLLYGRIPYQSGECFTALCMAERVFGNNGYYMLTLLDHFGINTSHFKSRQMHPVPWKRNELQLLYFTLKALPEHMFPLVRDISVTHGPRDKVDDLWGQADLFLTGEIVMFGGWSEHPEAADKIAALTHELGHTIDAMTLLSHTFAWLEFSEWETKSDGVTHVPHNPKTLISQYAHVNPDEDFAETFAAYRYNARQLKRISPDKYQFMKELVFGGIEYDSTHNCEKNSNVFSHVNYVLDFSNPGFSQCENLIFTKALRGSQDDDAIYLCLATHVKQKAIFDAEAAFANMRFKDIAMNLHKWGRYYVFRDQPITKEQADFIIQEKLAQFKSIINIRKPKRVGID